MLKTMIFPARQERRSECQKYKMYIFSLADLSQNMFNERTQIICDLEPKTWGENRADLVYPKFIFSHAIGIVR